MHPSSDTPHSAVYSGCTNTIHTLVYTQTQRQRHTNSEKKNNFEFSVLSFWNNAFEFFLIPSSLEGSLKKHLICILMADDLKIIITVIYSSWEISEQFAEFCNQDKFSYLRSLLKLCNSKPI